MNFEEFSRKLDEDACTTSSVGNTPGDPGVGTTKPKDKKIAKRKPVDEGVTRAAPGRQFGHTAGNLRGSSNLSDKPLQRMAPGAMAILKKSATHDDIADLDLHPDDKDELMKHLQNKKQHESYKIGDRVAILKEGYRFGIIRDINEEDGSYFVDPNSPLSRNKDLSIINLGESEIEPFVNIRKELELVLEALNKKDDDDESKKDDDDDESKKDDDEDESKKDDDEDLDEATLFIIDTLAAYRTIDESVIKSTAFKYSLMSDLSIVEAVDEVKAVKDLIDEAYDWDDDKLNKLHGDKKKWKALKTNRPDLATKMASIEASKKAASKPAAAPKVDHSEHIARMIDDSIGHSYPDSDPIDYLAPRLKQLGIHDHEMIKHLDHAAKKHLGSKDYHTHLAKAWDQHSSDTGSDVGNPWK